MACLLWECGDNWPLYDIIALYVALRDSYFHTMHILIKDPHKCAIRKDHSKLCQKSIFMVITSSMTSHGGLKISLYIHVYERLAPGANCKGNVSSINANIIIVFLGYTCQERFQLITLFEITSQNSASHAYWVTLALISNIANYLKYNYFWDCDGIDNVTLRPWIFSDFCSRHIAGVAGDDIMFHILVVYVSNRLTILVKYFSRCKT